METQHTAYRHFRSIANTDFGSLTPNNFNSGSNWLESVWKSSNKVSI